MRDFHDAYAEYAKHDPQRAPVERSGPPVFTMADLPTAPIRQVTHDGEKFNSSFGDTELLTIDYWTLRARSVQLFETNHYARGLVRRLVTNEINTGLHLEALPEESLLGVEKGGLADWAENIENRFRIWENDPRLCDVRELLTFGELQAAARREALISGDVLVVLEQDRRTNLPRVRLMSGEVVQTPLGDAGNPANGNEIKHGVEVDKSGRHVAYWIRHADSTDSLAGQLVAKPKRLRAYGRSGRRLAWLVYGTDKRLDMVRGQPLLSLALYSLRELDRYRDATQRKAALNALLAMFIEKKDDKPGTRPLTGGAVRRGTTITDQNTDEERSWNWTEHQPGLILDELQTGEVPHGFQAHGTDEKFGEFEEVIVSSLAWAYEIPPEILKLSFSSNYSASQAAINEFKIYLNPVRTSFGKGFCQPIYTDWLLSEALMQRVEAAELIEAWRDRKRYDVFGAWVMSEWAGQIKPAVDQSKLVIGYDAMVAAGYITRDRASRELTGTKFSKNVQQLELENEALAKANKPLAPPAPKVPAAFGKTKPEEDPDDVDKEDDDEDEGDKEERAAS